MSMSDIIIVIIIIIIIIMACYFLYNGDFQSCCFTKK